MNKYINKILEDLKKKKIQVSISFLKMPYNRFLFVLCLLLQNRDNSSKNCWRNKFYVLEKLQKRNFRKRYKKKYFPRILINMCQVLFSSKIPLPPPPPPSFTVNLLWQFGAILKKIKTTYLIHNNILYFCNTEPLLQFFCSGWQKNHLFTLFYFDSLTPVIKYNKLILSSYNLPFYYII